MLSHVASLLPYVFYGDTKAVVNGNINLLSRCYHNNNLPGFTHIYRQLCGDRSIETLWRGYNDYLIQIIPLHPPSSHVIINIMTTYALECWSSSNEEVVKLLLPYINKDDYYLLTTSGYLHLIPSYNTRVDIIQSLGNALEVNNIEEVRHILTLTTNLSNLQLYNSIMTPIDNRDALTLILPYIHTCPQRINSIIVTAYVNNALPDIPTELTNIAPIKILLAHFNNSILEDVRIDEEMFCLSEKFGFSSQLFYRCVQLAGENIINYVGRLSPHIQHKIYVSQLRINNKLPSSSCDCNMCEYLHNM